MAPKETKKSGLLSFFRKKHRKQAAAAPPPPTDSFAEINSLILSDQISIRKSTGATTQNGTENGTEPVKTSRSFTLESAVGSVGGRSRKTKAAPPPPPPPTEERAVDVHFSPKPAEQGAKNKREEHTGSREEKGRTAERNQNLEQKMVNEASESSTSRVETEVIHYSPHGSMRASTLSPDPVSDMPVIQRQSNIILNDSNRLKSIPVTCYDGRPPRQAAPPPPEPQQTPSPAPKKKKAPAPVPMSMGSKKEESDRFSRVSMESTSTLPPDFAKRFAKKAPTPLPSPVVPPTPPAHQRLESLDGQRKTDSLPRLDAPPKAIHQRAPSQQEDELKDRYEALKVKFDQWQMLTAKDKNSAEAQKLQKELVREHDAVMSFAKAALPDSAPSYPTINGNGKKTRPSLAPDTYSPKTWSSSVRGPLSISASHSECSPSSSSPSSSSSPGTSRSVTPKYATSSPSVSPAASIESADSGVGKGKKHPAVITEKSRRISILDENSNVVRENRPVKPTETDKQKATDRINEEVREQLRKEKALRREAQEKAAVSPLPSVDSIPKGPPSTPTVADEVKKETVNNNIQKQTNSKQLRTTPVALPSPPTPPVPTTPVPKIPFYSGNSSLVPPPTKREITSPRLGRVTKDKPSDKPSLANVRGVSLDLEPKPVRKLVNEVKTQPKTNEQRVFAVSSLNKTGATTINVRDDSKKEMVSANVPSKTSLSVKRTYEALPPTNNNFSPAPVIKTLISHSRDNSSSSTRSGVSAASSVKKNSPPVVKKQVLNVAATTPRPVSAVSSPASSRPTRLDMGEALGNGFPVLRRVAPPQERHGISLGKVVDTQPQPDSIKKEKSTTTPQGTPPAPPPPPPDLLTTPSATSSRAGPSRGGPPPAPPPPPPPPPLPSSPIVSMQQLNEQKQRLKPSTPNEKPARGPPDLRDSLMEEIRIAGGLKGLKKVSTQAR